MITLGGNVVIRNGNELDFSWRECIQSLLPVCDKVVVCDGESTDGTQEELRLWASREPKLAVCVYPWPNPKGDWEFFYKWINYAREHVPCDYQFQMDADEILSERSYAEVQSYKNRMQSGERFSVVCDRHNFWRDAKSIIPHGVCLGHRVIRIAPQNIPLASDGYHPGALEAPAIAIQSNIEIFHYGFLRKREEFFVKEKLLQEMFFNSVDPRLIAAEKFEGNWMTMPGVSGWENNPMECRSPHPRVAVNWLKEREVRRNMKHSDFASETAKYRSRTQDYCAGCGVDIGSHGVPVVPWAMNFELPEVEYSAYNSGLKPFGPIQLSGDARQLPFNNDSLDFVYSSHLLEDFSDWTPVLSEWVRVLKPGGFLIVIIPEKERWRKACEAGQPPNNAHKHEGHVGELSEYAERLNLRVLQDVLADCVEDDYSILFIAQKK